MRFQPGQSGNPAGRPPGSRNKRTIIAEKLLDERAGQVTTAAITRATDGDPAALRACMDRIAPRLRHRPLDFPLPTLVTLADTPIAINAIAQGLAQGELDLDEAAALMRAVRVFTLVLAAVERDKRAAAAADARRRRELGPEACRLPGGAHPMSRISLSREADLREAALCDAQLAPDLERYAASLTIRPKSAALMSAGDR